MVFIDVHCHLNYYDEKNIEKILKICEKKNVRVIIDHGVNTKSNRRSLEISAKNKFVKSALGMYPIEALKLNSKEIDKELEFIENNKEKVIAVGEIGLDKKEENDFKWQKEVFEKFVKLGIRIDKPVIVHSREAETECVDMLEKLKAKKVVMHCFSGRMSLVKRIAENRWFLSIPSSVKYNEHFQKIVEITPIENILCETDSPYLHPEREKNNTPLNVIASYEKIAEIKKVSLKDIEKLIEKNYESLFG